MRSSCRVTLPAAGPHLAEVEDPHLEAAALVEVGDALDLVDLQEVLEVAVPLGRVRDGDRALTLERLVREVDDGAEDGGVRDHGERVVVARVAVEHPVRLDDDALPRLDGFR